MIRKKLGIGLGKGYKNLIYSDPKVHSDSAKGIKQSQRIFYQPFYNGTYNRKIFNVKYLISTLKQRKLKNIKFTKNKLSFDFGIDHIIVKIKYNRTVKNIANWSHSLKDKRIFIDKDAKYKKQLAIHEAIEKFVSEKFGLKYSEAHDVAEHFEKQYAKSQGINWDKSQKAIFKTKI